MVWWRTLTERARASLFLVPTLSVLVAIVVGELTLALDASIDEVDPLPFARTSTVDSARAALAAVAAATISFAGIAFSVALLVIQLGSSQYSPRVVHTLFRDPFNKRIMGLVVGTFTYCLIILRSVRGPAEFTGEAVIPNLSVALAVVLGIVSILAIVAFIDHSAHTMDISEILERVTHDSIETIAREWSTEPNAPEPDELRSEPVGDPMVVRFDRTGWVAQIDGRGLLGSAPSGATVILETYPGRYAMTGAPLCQVRGVSVDEKATLERRMRAAVGLGATRTMQQDVAYGLRQLADVALRALSPGVNDPTTAQDAIFHQAAVLTELLRRSPAAVETDDAEQRTLVWAQRPSHADLVALAFDEIRRSATDQPTVCIYLLEALNLVADCLRDEGLDDRLAPLEVQARLVVEGAERAALHPRDVDLVRDAYRTRFMNDVRP